MIRRLFCSLVLILAGRVLADGQAIDTLTVDEAVDMALQHNLDLQEAEYQTASQEVSLGQERLSLFPQLSFATSGSRSYGLSFDETAGELTRTATDYVSGRVGANIQLFNGFERFASLKQAGARVDAAQESEQWTRQTTVFQTLQQFLQVVVRKEIVRIRRANVESQEEMLGKVREYIDVGRQPASDLYKQQEALAASQSSLLQAEHELRLARLQLAQTLGRSTSSELRFEAPTIDSTDLTPASFDSTALVRQGLEHRSDIQSQRASLEAAEQSIRAARGTFWPSISLGAGYGSSFSSAAGTSGLQDQLDRNRGGSISLSVSIPITNLLQGRQQVERARIQQKQSRLQARRTEQQAVRQIREAQLTYDYYSKQLEVTNRRLAAAETALEGDEERYRLGRATIVDVAQSRASYVQARSERAQTKYQFLFQEKVIDYQVGSLEAASGEGVVW